VTRNTARDQALRINAALEKDPWKDANRLHTQDNMVEDHELTVGLYSEDLVRIRTYVEQSGAEAGKQRLADSVCDDDASVTSSNEGFVFSITSLASSVSDMSKGSGYSATQIATATREVLSIFRDDKLLQPLYKTAIYGAIGPRRFGKAFRRLLKAFANDLKDEAKDRLDFLAARLVAWKARELAEVILERFQPDHALVLDIEEGKGYAPLNRDDQDSSDEDEQEEMSVNESIFEELTTMREYLVQDAAFTLLQTNSRHFVSSRKPLNDFPGEQGNSMYTEEQTSSHKRAHGLRLHVQRQGMH
jgi:hypothetical protein